jgi:hypothetical protein
MSVHRHGWRMILGGVLPLLAIFLLPLVGISGWFAILIAMVLLLGVHLFVTAGPHEHD